MKFRLLGRLEVEDAATPARPKQRMLLALLLLRAGERVSVDEAVDALWGEAPPPAARNALQGHVSALRRLLGRDRIETREGGYVLRLEEDELDLHRFERLLTDARGRGPREQIALIEAALALFRGRPLDEFRYESFALAEAARIDELRTVAVGLKLDAELALGRHEEVLPELERVVVESPLREGFWAQLMLALYRAGRQADALAAYQRARATLAEQAGLEPGPALRRLERQILNQHPQLAASAPAATQLPTPPTPLIGRERELAEAGELCARGDVRLVTLIGAGGIGKTRLALEVARHASAAFPGGTFFVPLASLGDPELVLPAIAHAVGAAEGGETLESAVASRLGGRPTLVLLDNLEHLIAGVAALGRLLAAVPALKVLVTSREPLRLYGEHRYRVPPLDIAEATSLFLDRAEAVGGNVDRAAQTLDTVAEICRRLDRLPLAIELAAARTDVLPPAALLERLGERLLALMRGPVDQPLRQQTLRGTLAWSCDRLSGDERRLFARLAVFAGGWTLDAAAAICGEERDIVQHLSSLVDKSLLQARPADESPRQEMLETIREYANELLAAAGETEELSRRHAHYFLDLAEESELHLRGDPGPWLERLELEHDNLSAALDRLDAIGERELELRLAGALWRFWYLRGRLIEGRHWLERVLAADGRPTPARAKALLGSAVMHVNLRDGPTAAARCDEALRLHEQLGDAWGAAYARFMLGNVAEDRERARGLYERSLNAFRELGDDHSALLVTRHLALTTAELGEHGRARSLHENNLERARATGNKRMEASTLGALADYAIEDGRHAAAAALLRRSLAIHRELGDVLDTAVDLCRFAAATGALGDPITAVRVLASFEALGDAVGGRRAWVAQLNEQTLAAARADLAGEAFVTAWAEGLELGLDDAIEVALAATADEGPVQVDGQEKAGVPASS